MDLIRLHTINGAPYASSLEIAQRFLKEHKNVLAAIRELENSGKFNALNFKPVEYTDKKGEKRPYYLLSRKVFSILVMGFTGSKALDWKIKYDDAFEAMANQLTENLRGQLNQTMFEQERDAQRIARERVKEANKLVFPAVQAHNAKHKPEPRMHVGDGYLDIRKACGLKLAGGIDYDFMNSTSLTVHDSSTRIYTKAMSLGLPRDVARELSKPEAPVGYIFKKAPVTTNQMRLI